MIEKLIFILHYTGILKIFRFLNRKKIKILMYHRVDDNNLEILPPYASLAVSIKNFDEQMKFLKNNYNVIKFEDIDNAQDYSVIITFDDGYLDNYNNAYPVLKKYNLPATIFVATDAIDGKPLWINKYYHCLTKVPLKELIIYFNKITKANIKLKKNKIKSAEEIQHFLMFNTSKEDREKIITELLKYFKLNPSTKDYMTWKHLSEMKKNNISIGSHTSSHPLLSTLTLKEIEKELSDSKKKIKKKINNIILFSYPWGNKSSFNNEIIKVVSKYYKYAVTNIHNLNFKNKLLLPRIPVPNKNADIFSAYIELVNIIKIFKK